VDKTGTVLVAAFKDGVVRVVVVSLEPMKEDPTSNKEFVTIIQTSKPHAKPITAMSLNDKGTVLVTGSEDSTIFVYHITESDKNVSLVPIGFVTVPNVVTFLSWKPYMVGSVQASCNYLALGK
jgi:WD40 repeat protein